MKKTKIARSCLDPVYNPIWLVVKGETIWSFLAASEYLLADRLDPGWGFVADGVTVYFEELFELLDWVDDRVRLRSGIKPVSN